ncbi:MAG: hypothetical protein OEY97_08190 [Nitrospirota bacterium]|nr:hypothetical protein [Nitrospirota bacterium]
MKEIKVKCLSCGSLERGDFCGGCHTILPIGKEEVDFFSMFGFESRPALDAMALKERFLELSHKLHPDRHNAEQGDQRLNVLTLSAQLNQGYRTLLDTKERLRYLVGKQTNQEPLEAKQVPPEMMELFFEVHDLMEETDTYLKNRKPAASRIVAALSMADSGRTELLDRINTLRRRGQQKVADVEAEINQLDKRWDDDGERPAILERCARLADVLSYMGRLTRSLDEKELKLEL